MWNEFGTMPAEIEFVLRLAFAALLGAVMGLERTIAGKHAGMRTYALVSMGSALFVALGIISAYQFSIFSSVNPLHLAGFVIVGIGFIGSGLAISYGGGHPELTTASGIWVVAGIGMASGFGLYWLAAGATLLAVFVFKFLLKIENNLRRRWGVSEQQ